MFMRAVMLYLTLFGFAHLSVLQPGPAIASPPAAPKTAVFPFEIIIEQQMGDLGLPPVASKPEQARLKLVTDELTRLLRETGKYEPLDLAAVNSDIVEQAPFNQCNGCEVEVARKAGAELSMLGVVQKATAMLLNVSIFVRDVEGGTLRRSMAVSIRENSDEGWLRAVRWLVHNRLSDQEPQK